MKLSKDEKVALAICLVVPTVAFFIYVCLAFDNRWTEAFFVYLSGAVAGLLSLMYLAEKSRVQDYNDI